LDLTLSILQSTQLDAADAVQTREQYDQAIAICRDAIAQWDPFALLAGGAPADEYDLEISKLVPKIRDARASSDVAIAISAIFGDSFGHALHRSGESINVAAEIYNRLRSAGLLSA
jgi:Domain of unknown function (DUF1871)